MNEPGETSVQVIGETESVCPVCLRTIPAQRVKIGHDVFLQKTCGEHGFFSTVIWRGEPSYLSWYKPGGFEAPEIAQTESEKGCPRDCGLCSRHRQKSCCVLLEVTARCNLKCPVCYADAGRDDSPDPSVEELKKQLKAVRDAAGGCHILLSGGEPTVREDLPRIIKEARSIGFTFFQLNTNGIRLAEDPDYIKDLKEAGLSTVFLQFDGIGDDVYEQLRGRALMQTKKKAIENCGHHGMGVVLVPTLIPGVNTDSIGGIIDYAVKGLPTIRGVHFQPVSYFGRNPKIPSDEKRITLPEVMKAIEVQTGGQMKAMHFFPTGCRSTLCSFHGDFRVSPEGTLSAVSAKNDSCCGKANGTGISAVQKNRNFVKNRWQLRMLDTGCCSTDGTEYDDWDIVLDQMKNRRISISSMAFQDADTLDLERLRQCGLHVVHKNRIVPFCAFNLTGGSGQTLYRG